MDEQEVPALPDTAAAAYSMYFGISCAFVGLHLMSKTRKLDVELSRWSQMGELMLQGSTQLLGLLVEGAQTRVEALEEAVSEVGELRRQRAEDAKANEKVVGIFAAHEQSWIAERKKLRVQVQALLNELRVVKARRDEAISDLNKRVEEEEQALQLKDEELEEEVRRRKELEEKLFVAEDVVEELRERGKNEAQDHSSELWKHKTAFTELVSNQRQLEADLGRALRQADASKQVLDEMYEQKEEAVSMVEKYSGEIVKLQKDGEHKDKILSAMLRKSKIDTTEKQMLLKEVKISKAKKKQAELDCERWRNIWESRNKKSSRLLKSAEAGSSEERRPELQLKSDEHRPSSLLLEYLEAERRKEQGSPSPKGENIIRTVHCLDQHSSNETNDLVTDDTRHLRDWVRLETEKCVTTLEQRHYTDIEAFMEEMRLKDEKLEAFHWQLLSKELELKSLQSHIDGLDGSLSQFNDENLKLEAMLLDMEKELKSVKEQLNYYVQHWQKSNSKATSSGFDPQVLSSDVKITKKISREKEQERKAILVRKHQMEEHKIEERDDQDVNEDRKLLQLDSPHRTSSNESSPLTDHLKDYPIIYTNELSFKEPRRTERSTEYQEKNTNLVTRFPNEEIEEDKELIMDPVHVSIQNGFHETSGIANKAVSTQKTLTTEKTFTTKDFSWRMDIHALGVSYKIKRLKQQLLVLEKVSGTQATKQSMIQDDAPDGSKERKVDMNCQPIKGLPIVISLLNKQVKRYQSLEEKTDDLCRRMQESYRTRSSRFAHDNRKEQTQLLESFLGETFQLQRYMVATGQKLLEMQSRINCSFADSDGLDKLAGFSMRQFADIVRNLFKEIQRGLEVRISRVIGDLEGTLTCDGIHNS